MNSRFRQYGIIQEEFDAFLVSQSNSCAICSIPFNHGNYRRDWPQVDHDHVTGRVRGLLCHKCNTGIGMLKHDPELFDKARLYILASWKGLIDEFFAAIEKGEARIPLPD